MQLVDDATWSILCLNLHCRCVAFTLPLKRMEWMSVKSAKTKIIPLIVLFNVAYNSYKVLLLVEVDVGKFGCNPAGGKPELVGLLVTFVAFFLKNLIKLIQFPHTIYYSTV